MSGGVGVSGRVGRQFLLFRFLLRDVIVRVLFRYYDVMSQVLLTFLHLYCDILTAMLGFEFLL